LDNRTTAMTGHQPNPSTGFLANGEPTHAVDIKKLCESVGVNQVDEINPFDLDHVKKVLDKHFQLDEPSVIISRSPCILYDRSVVAPPMTIDQDVCKKCKKCLKLGCPAISFDGSSVLIEANLCSGCTLCLQVCPFDAIKEAKSE